jgi:uncharacterized protein (TIGR03067 family)
VACELHDHSNRLSRRLDVVYVSPRIHLATAAALAAAGLPGARADDGDAARLAGRWELVSEVTDGVRTEETPDTAEWVIRGNRVTDLIHGKELFRTRYRLRSGSDPKAFDLMERHPRRVATRAIYAADGDTLTVAFYREAGKSRPGDFESKPDDDKVVRVYRRRKSRAARAAQEATPGRVEVEEKLLPPNHEAIAAPTRVAAAGPAASATGKDLPRSRAMRKR